MSVTPAEEARLNTNTGSGPYVKYLVRRETHSSRALSAIVVSIIGIAILIYLVVEGIMAMAGKPPLWMRPTQWVEGLVKLPQTLPVAALIAIGVVIVLVGLFLLSRALLPGVLGRHAIRDNRSAVVVDDAVIAAAISASVRKHANLHSGQVRTDVSRKRVDVTITPTSGRELDVAAYQKLCTDIVTKMDLDPKPNVKVHATKKGAI